MAHELIPATGGAPCHHSPGRGFSQQCVQTDITLLHGIDPIPRGRDALSISCRHSELHCDEEDDGVEALANCMGEVDPALATPSSLYSKSPLLIPC